jgi:hypothetical protein
MGKVIRLQDAAARGGAAERGTTGSLPDWGLSPFLTSVATVAFDFSVDRRALDAFLERAAGTAADGLDAERARLAGAWLATDCAPAWLRAVGRAGAAEQLAAVGARLDAIGAAELATAGAIVADLRGEMRDKARGGPFTASAGGLVLGVAAALWAGVADRYSGRPGPVWFGVVKDAWTASWMGARLAAARGGASPDAVRAGVEARAWETALALARPGRGADAGPRRLPRGGWPHDGGWSDDGDWTGDGDWRPDAG